MADIYIDTTKINECGEDLIKLSTEFSSVVNTMFERISKISDSEKVWAGGSAEEFKQLAKLDKKQYVTFATDFYNFGKYLIDYSASMDSTLRGVKK